MISRSLFARATMALATVALLAAPARAADPAFPLASHVGLVAPGGMQMSQAFRGFENRDASASIIIIEIPPQAYAGVEKQLTDEALKKEGMTEEKREAVTLKDGTGVLLSGTQETDKK